LKGYRKNDRFDRGRYFKEWQFEWEQYWKHERIDWHWFWKHNKFTRNGIGNKINLTGISISIGNMTGFLRIGNTTSLIGNGIGNTPNSTGNSIGNTTRSTENA
jgi:hypothetical protein